MRAHCAGARAIAGYLADHPAVTQVFYPGLEDHPGHEVAAAPDGGVRRHGVVPRRRAPTSALDVARRTELFFLAESLGGVESLIEVPGPMTHASVAGSPLEVPADLVRLSVGIEHPDDLIEDLDRAL